MDIGFFGGTGTVTGSKYLVRSGGHQVLVDCGLFQGYKPLRLRNWAQPGFAPRDLDAVMLTHAHLDHSGYVPLLVKNGFDGPIHCTHATFELCRILLPDSGRIQEEDAERANRHGYSRHDPARPLYTEADALRALQRFEPRPFHAPFSPAPPLTAELIPAGHILGSAMIALRDARTSILFSGDLGRPADSIMRAPEAPPDADHLVIESTYGDRLHPTTDATEELGSLIVDTVRRGGVVVIPTFAVGRTQSLLWSLLQLKARKVIPEDLPIFLNSPLAVDATSIYRRHHAEHRLSDDESTSMGRVARYVNTVEESKALNRRKGPMVILACSGMATGGRVVHHLKAFAPDPENLILFAGFQAGGTRGAAMLGGADSIKIHGEFVAVRARVKALPNLSAHADYAEVLGWMRGFAKPPRRTFITHGEPAASDALRVHIQERLGWVCQIPEYRDVIPLDPSAT